MGVGPLGHLGVRAGVPEELHLPLLQGQADVTAGIRLLAVVREVQAVLHVVAHARATGRGVDGALAFHEGGGAAHRCLPNVADGGARGHARGGRRGAHAAGPHGAGDAHAVGGVLAVWTRVFSSRAARPSTTSGRTGSRDPLPASASGATSMPTPTREAISTTTGSEQIAKQRLVLPTAVRLPRFSSTEIAGRIQDLAGKRGFRDLPVVLSVGVELVPFVVHEELGDFVLRSGGVGTTLGPWDCPLDAASGRRSFRLNQ